MAMHNPPHPGGIVKRQCLEPLGLTVTRAAEGLGVTRQALSELVNERTGVSVEMAIRLSKAFGSTPETWLGMQTAYDLWQARARAAGDRGRALCGGVMHEVAASKRSPAAAARAGPTSSDVNRPLENMSERPATRSRYHALLVEIARSELPPGRDRVASLRSRSVRERQHSPDVFALQVIREVQGQDFLASRHPRRLQVLKVDIVAPLRS